QFLGGRELLLAEQRPAVLVLPSSEPVEGAFGFALFSGDDQAVGTGNVHRRSPPLPLLCRHQIAAWPCLQEGAKLHLAHQAVGNQSDWFAETVLAAPQAPGPGIAMAQEIAPPEVELSYQS